MLHSAEMQRCLADLDIAAMRRLSAHIWPHLPQPKTDNDVLVSIHHARTQMGDIMPFKLRAYSHRWLMDNGYPSGLHDRLRPKAERMYPQVVDVVGIACRGSSEIGRAVAPIIQGAMSDAVLESYADGQRNPAIVKPRMMEARQRTIRKLLGRRVNVG